MGKISYSRYKRFLTCPQLDYFHSVEKLRPKTISSDLVFGVAIDNALNALLTKSGNPIDVFQNEFDWQKLPNVNWDMKDLQYDMFSKEDLDYLAEHSEEYLVYACLRRKGRIMIEAYQEYMLPLIKEVHHVQKDLESRPGILDAILTIDGYGYVLADHKTARQPYKANAIEADTQLALYSADQKIKKVAFIVLIKTFRFQKICRKCGHDGTSRSHTTCPAEINKTRCHGPFQRSVDKSKIIQLMVQDAPTINQELVRESINEVEKLIETGCKYKNLSACGNMYGKPCVYIDKCWKNSNNGLEIKKENK